MSTRGIIARHTGKGTFTGVYHHSDSYPEGLGATLYSLYGSFFESNSTRMQEFLIDEHPGGWSIIQGCDMSLPAGYVESNTRFEKDAQGWADYSKPIPTGPRCFCHGDRSEAPNTLTETSTCWAEWVYALTDFGTMYIYRRPSEQVKGGPIWELAAYVNLEDQEPDWKVIECGVHLERCLHMASHHFPELKGTTMERLTTEEFLGHSPITQSRSAYAFEKGGRRYKPTGSSGRGFSSKREEVWIARVEEIPSPGGATPSPNFKELTVSRFNSQGEEKPYPGVKWILPPTLKQPLQVLAELRSKILAIEEKLAAVDTSTDTSANTPSTTAGLLPWQQGRKFRDLDQNATNVETL